MVTPVAPATASSTMPNCDAEVRRYMLMKSYKSQTTNNCTDGPVFFHAALCVRADDKVDWQNRRLSLLLTGYNWCAMNFSNNSIVTLFVEKSRTNPRGTNPAKATAAQDNRRDLTVLNISKDRTHNCRVLPLRRMFILRPDERTRTIVTIMAQPEPP